MSTEALKIGPVDQTQLVLYASKNTSLSACDLAVLAEITDRYLKLKGVTYPTGLTHLVRETGRSHSSVQDSVRRLLSFGYISVTVEGKGTRGSEYDLNFDWVRQVSERVKGAKADRTRAKKFKSKKKASVPADHTTTENKIVYRNSTPLRELVGVPTDTLGNPAYRNSGTQTYWCTNSTPSTVAKNWHSGLGASAVSAPLREEYAMATITHAELDTENEGKSTMDDDEELDDIFFISSTNPEEAEDGLRRLNLLSDALTLDIDAKDPSHLVGAEIVIKRIGQRILGYYEEEPAVRRDVTILSVKAADEGGYRVGLQFNDCEEGDVPTHTIKLSSTNGLQTAASRTGRNLAGARVFLDAYGDLYVFQPHPENEQSAGSGLTLKRVETF